MGYCKEEIFIQSILNKWYLYIKKLNVILFKYAYELKTKKQPS